MTTHRGKIAPTVHSSDRGRRRDSRTEINLNSENQYPSFAETSVEFTQPSFESHLSLAEFTTRGMNKGTPMPSSLEQARARRLKRLQETSAKREDEHHTEFSSANVAFPVPSSSFVQVHIVNGKLAVNSDALVVPAAGTLDPTAEQVVVENDERATTAASYRDEDKKRVVLRPDKWSNSDTEKFYDALGYWGTDFSLIALMFSNRERGHIKLKFKREERSNPARIQQALSQRKKMDPVQYKLLLQKVSEQTNVKEN